MKTIYDRHLNTFEDDAVMVGYYSHGESFLVGVQSDKDACDVVFTKAEMKAFIDCILPYIEG